MVTKNKKVIILLLFFIIIVSFFAIKNDKDKDLMGHNLHPPSFYFLNTQDILFE